MSMQSALALRPMQQKRPPPEPISSVSAPGWCAVQCQPNRERIAAFHLRNQGFSVFLPLREKTRRHARRIEKARVPFFPGYLFIRLDLGRDRWRCVNGTVGVVRLVMQGLTPAFVAKGVVEKLLKAADKEHVLKAQPALKAGESVRVIGGPFVDFLGKLMEMTEKGRLRVLLNLLGGATSVLLSKEQVVSADSLL